MVCKDESSGGWEIWSLWAQFLGHGRDIRLWQPSATMRGMRWNRWRGHGLRLQGQEKAMGQETDIGQVKVMREEEAMVLEDIIGQEESLSEEKTMGPEMVMGQE